MRLSKEPTQKDWILKINLKSGSGSVSCRPPRVRHTDIYRSRFYPISVVLLTLTLAVLTCSELRLRVSTLELRELRSVSGNKWWQAHYIVMAVCLLAPSSLRLLFTFNWGVSIRISASKHSPQSSQMYAKSFRQECETFSDVEFCSLAPFFVFSCSGFSLTFQFLPQKLTNISFKKLSPLKLQAHYFFHISDCRKFC